MISRSIGFVKRYILLPAVVVLFLMASSVAKPEPSSAWSIEGIARYDGTHRWITEQVIHWFKQHEWTFNGEPIQFEDWGVLVRGSEQPDCAAHGLAGILTPRPCSPLTNPPDDEFEKLEGVYHRILDKEREFCHAYTEPDEAWICDLIGVFNPDTGAEAQAINWANEAKQNKNSDLQKVMRKAGYAIHFAQDAVNPPHVDPWREGLTWTDCRVEKSIGPVTIQRPRRGSPPHTSFERFVDGYVNHRWDNPTEFNLNDNNLTVANIREKILELTAQTDTDWEPDPQSIFGNWQCYDPFEPYGSIESQQTKQKIAQALDRAAYLTQLILIYVFDLRQQLTESPWPMFQHDAQHTGRSPHEGAQAGELKWFYDMTYHSFGSSPVIDAQSVVYITSFDGILHAIRGDGQKKWSFALGQQQTRVTTPSIGSDGTIYVGSGVGNLYAINPDGSLKWNFATGDRIDSSPVIDSAGTIYFGSWDGKLYALNSDGSLKWNVSLGIRVHRSPAIAINGTIYVRARTDALSTEGTLNALNPDGSMQWSYKLGDGESSPAIGPDGTIYITSYLRKLYAIKPDGSLRWSYDIGETFASPAIGIDGTVYVGSHSPGQLYAFDPDGFLKWTFTTGGGVDHGPAIGTDGTIYFGSDDDKFYAIKPDGTLQWSFATGGNIISESAIGIDRTVYVASQDAKLYAFGPTD